MLKVARHRSSLASSDLHHIVDSDNSGGWGFFAFWGELIIRESIILLDGNPTSLIIIGNQRENDFEHIIKQQQLV
jgi:hypothetical protein